MHEGLMVGATCAVFIGPGLRWTYNHSTFLPGIMCVFQLEYLFLDVVGAFYRLIKARSHKKLSLQISVVLLLSAQIANGGLHREEAV